MITAYLSAIIAQDLERARLLKAKISVPTRDAILLGLRQVCEQHLNALIQQFQALQDAKFKNQKLQPERLRLYKKTHEDLTQLESTAVTALNRVSPEDIFLSKMVFGIHSEIAYPLQPPTVTCTSQNYFWIRPDLSLLAVPPAESDFLLHLPDLYHEMGHPLISTSNNPKVEPFRQQLGTFLGFVQQHYQKDRADISRTPGPKDYLLLLTDVVERSWIQFWATEFFCDLFALYTLGPAFAWSHLYLTTKHGGDPYHISPFRLETHPPDNARMEALLVGLDLIGFQAQISPIQVQWNYLLSAIPHHNNPAYARACPKALIDLVAVHALEATKSIGCTIVSAASSALIGSALNTAWAEFWKSPTTYVAWEQSTLASLRQKLS